MNSRAVPGTDGTSLSDFEEHDYSLLWEDKQLEDLAQKRIISDWLGRGENCLELGGGYGRLTGLLESRFSEVMMLEFARRNISMARKKLSKAHIVRADVAHIPARSDEFDCAIMVRVVHLLPDPAKVMKEVHRVVKNGGTVIISVPNLQMNRLSWDLKELLLPERIRSRFQTYGKAEWPYDEKPHFLPHRYFVPDSFKPCGRRGTGMFDNYIGKMLARFRSLHLIDVATSPAWFFKFDVFMRFEVRKAR